MGINGPEDLRSDERGVWPIAHPSPEPVAANLGSETSEELQVCPACDSRLVYPVEWAPIDMRRWRVELRCPDCEWVDIAIHEQDVLDRFDQALDAASDAMLDDLRRLQRSNMADEVERFNMALAQDLILPEDF